MYRFSIFALLFIILIAFRKSRDSGSDISLRQDETANQCDEEGIGDPRDVILHASHQLRRTVLISAFNIQ